MNDYILSEPDYSPAALAEADIEDIRFDERNEAANQAALDAHADAQSAGYPWDGSPLLCRYDRQPCEFDEACVEVGLDCGCTRIGFASTCHGTGYTEGSE